MVSGFNIGLIYRFVIRISTYTGRKKAYFFSLFPLLIYFLLVGTDNIPCLRAILMASIVILAGITERRVGFGQSWGLALLLILIVVIILKISLKLAEIRVRFYCR